MNKIILTGYMASGKSVVAALLAAKIQYRHIDLDQYIESKYHMSIAALFEIKGEIYFRKIEHQLLAEIMEVNTSMVISLGGGTPCYANNHEVLTRSGVVSFYLKSSVEELARRLKSEKKDRPLISNLADGEMKEFIAKHLFERSFFYNKATHVINVDGRSPDAIATEMQLLLI